MKRIHVFFPGRECWQVADDQLLSWRYKQAHANLHVATIHGWSRALRPFLSPWRISICRYSSSLQSENSNTIRRKCCPRMCRLTTTFHQRVCEAEQRPRVARTMPFRYSIMCWHTEFLGEMSLIVKERVAVGACSMRFSEELRKTKSQDSASLQKLP